MFGTPKLMTLNVRFGWWLVCCISVASLVLANPVAAETPTPSDDEVNRVAKQLYCPVCEGVPLDVCPTAACAQWREDIRQRLGQGWTDEEVREYFAARYGDQVLAEPPARGFSALVYILPVLGLLIGAALLVRWLRSARSLPAEAVGGAEPVPDEYVARLERELEDG